MASIDDIVTNQGLILRALYAIQQAILDTFPRITGSFTLSAGATTTVTEPAVSATSVIQLMPTNASGGTLQGSAKALYISARTAGASFAVTTASGAAAAGTEQFFYVLVNPS